MKPLDEQEWAVLLTKPDPFKLSIKGHSALEAILDAAIAEVLDDSVVKELSRVPFKSKLGLAVGLRLIAPSDRAPLAQLANLRNDFAHGKLAHLTPRRARRLFDEVLRPLLPHQILASLEKQALDPRMVLRVCLIAAQARLDVYIRAARVRREEEREIVDRHHKLEPTLQALIKEFQKPAEPS